MINFFVTVRAKGAERAVSSVIRSKSREILEQKLQQKTQNRDIEVISIVPVCQINEMCK